MARAVGVGDCALHAPVSQTRGFGLKFKQVMCCWLLACCGILAALPQLHPLCLLGFTQCLLLPMLLLLPAAIAAAGWSLGDLQ